MKLSLTNISLFDFCQQLEKFLIEIEKLKNSRESNVKKYSNLTDKQISKVEKFISSHIEPNAEAVLSLLKDNSGLNDYLFFGHIKDTIENVKARHSLFQEKLKLVINYIPIIESIVNPESTVDIDSISEKKDFVLKKLYILFGEGYYSIFAILKLNGIKFRNGEAAEIGEDLEKRGYVNFKEYGNPLDVQISVKGASYIERKNKQKKNTKTKNDLDKRIDIIIEHLVKLGYGQEILFDEINELKELQHTLSKKSFSQLLKGKLLDLAIDKIISKETASFVFEYLTNNSFKLLK